MKKDTGRVMLPFMARRVDDKAADTCRLPRGSFVSKEKEESMRRVLILVLCILVIAACTQMRNDKKSSFSQRNTASTQYKAPKPTLPRSEETVDPVVGMSLSAIPSAWVWQGTDYSTVTTQSGSKIKTNKYRYDTPTVIYVIWVTEHGYIAKVSETETEKTQTTGRTTGRTRDVTPSLDVSSFNDPEDFYDWYYDDFSDFEEAEDYYYSHGGW